MNVNEEAAIEVFNGFGQKIEVLMQEEVLLDVNVPLFYIKSGEEEIQAYVDNHAKPQLTEFTAGKIVEIETAATENEEKAKENIETFVTEEVNPSIQQYVDAEIKPVLDASVAEAATSAAAALVSEQNASGHASSAAQSATSAEQSAESAAQVVAGFDQHAADKQSAFDAHASEVQNSFDENAGAKTSAFDENYNSKLGTINTTAAEQTAAVSAEGTAQISAVGTAGAAEIAKVQEEGAEQVENARIQAQNSASSANLSAQSATAAANSSDLAAQYAVAARPLGIKNITNCLTSIPQDIKYTLVDGVFTLKAGSKVYVPAGFEEDGTTRKFDVQVVESDASLQAGSWDNKDYLFVYNLTNNNLDQCIVAKAISGSTAPTKNYSLWYDTENNLMKKRNVDELLGDTFSLPVALVANPTGNLFTSVKEAFNGFGFIGSTVFATPGVKGLIPNGRNNDGSLNNIEFITSSVSIIAPVEINRYCSVFVNGNNQIESWGKNGGNVQYFKTRPTVAPIEYCRAFIEDENRWIVSLETTAWVDELSICECFWYQSDSNGVITSFTPKTTFHAVDYNHMDNLMDNKFKVVSALPASPETGTFYFIPE